eukprot:426753-Rhodomonas_salina.1
MNAGGRGGQRGMSTGQERTPHLKGAGLRRWVRGQELSDQIEADLNQAKKRANTKLYNRLINKVAACRFALQDAVLTEGVRQYAKQKSPATAMRVFQQMKKCGIKPTHFTWGCLINAYSMNGDAAKAEKQMHDMLRAGEDANWVVVTSVIKVKSQAGEIESAIALMKQMEEKIGEAPNVRTYNALLRGCLRHGDTDAGDGLYEEMKKRGLDPDESTLDVMAGKIKEMNRALKRFSSIDKVIAPNENWIARQDLEKEGGDKVGRCFKWVVTYGVYVDLGAGRRVDLWSVRGGGLTYGVCVDLGAERRVDLRVC